MSIEKLDSLLLNKAPELRQKVDGKLRIEGNNLTLHPCGSETDFTLFELNNLQIMWQESTENEDVLLLVTNKN